MKIKKINILPPAIIIESNSAVNLFRKTMRNNFIEAVSIGPIVFTQKNVDNCLIKHELLHVKYFWISLGILSILYLFSKRVRYWTELNCYTKQIICQIYQIKSIDEGDIENIINRANELINHYAFVISHYYRLFTFEKVLEDLSNKVMEELRWM